MSEQAPPRPADPSDDLIECNTMSQLIDVMLGELGDGPEPLQHVPEELQPMLERLQRMAERNQMRLDRTDPLHVADQYPPPQQYQPYPPHPQYQPFLYPGYGAYESPENPGQMGELQYAQAYQTISELCQIMSPPAPPDSPPTYLPPEPGVVYQPSTSYGYPGGAGPANPPYAQLPHLAPGQPLAPTPTLRELLSPPKPKPPEQQPDQGQPKGEALGPSGGGRTLCRRSVADQDDPEFWLNQI